MDPPTTTVSSNEYIVQIQSESFVQQEDEGEQNKGSKNDTAIASPSSPLSPLISKSSTETEQEDTSITNNTTDTTNTTASSSMSPLKATTKTNTEAAAHFSAPPAPRSLSSAYSNDTSTHTEEIKQEQSQTQSASKPSSRNSLQGPPPNTTAHVTKSSFLTRKAHKFSSLKKKKGASTLINKLFCNTTPVTTNTETTAGRTPTSSSTRQKAAPKTPSLLDQTSPQTSAENSPTIAAAAAAALESAVTDNASCVSLSAALEQASESLTLNAETQVRSTIQGSMNDAFTAATATTKEAADKHTHVRSKSTTVQGSLTDVFTAVIKDIATYDKKKTMNMTSTTKLAASQTPPHAASKRPMKTPGGMTIATPAGSKKSLFPSTLDQSPLFRSKRDEVLRANSEDSNNSDSAGGGSTTPTPFIKFASTDHSVVMAPSDEPTSSMRTARAKNTSGGYLSRFIAGTTGTGSTGFTPNKEITSTSSGFTPNTTPMKNKEDTVPGHSQLEDDCDNDKSNSVSKVISPVKEPGMRPRAVVDQADDDDDAAFLPDDFKLDTVVSVEKEEQREQPEPSAPEPTIAAIMNASVNSSTTPVKSPNREMGRRYTWSEMDRRIADAVEIAKDEWNKIMGEEVKAHVAEEQEQKLDLALKESKSEAEELLQEHSEQWKQEHDAELKVIKSKFERKIMELKDQSALANRLTKTREAEFEALEAEMETLRQEAAAAVAESQAKPDVPLEDESELEQVRAEQAKEMESVNTELATVKEKLVAAVKEASVVMVKLSAKEKESTTAKARLSFAEKEATEAKSKLSSMEKEAEEAKSKLAEKEAEEAKSKLAGETNTDARVSLLEKEAVELKAKLSQSETQVAETREQLSIKEKAASDLKSQLSIEQKAAADSITKQNSQDSEAAEQETEAAELTAQLSLKDQEVTASTAKLTNQGKELESLKAKLTSKDKEVTSLREKLAAEVLKATSLRTSGSTAYMSPSRAAKTPGRSPGFKSPGRAGSLTKKPASNSKPVKDSESTETNIELHEREKESWRAQITTLEEQLAKASTEHECALQQLREVGETELSQVKKDMEQLEQKIATTSPSPGRSPSFKSPGRAGKPGSNSKSRRDSESIESNVELHEREKESLRAQIATLEEQLARSSTEHERALMQLREASETELWQVKKDMEHRLEHHMAKERELKETLSEVSSRDKEDLLEEIELLQAEKKADRNGGLREVQKKEDLLKRIAALEKMEKDLATEHERSLQDVRDQSEGDIRRLKKELEQQRSERMAKERELHLAISETGSFEKEELLAKVEKLESKLEGERNGSVLVKMKIAVLEKELRAEEKKHGEEMEKLRATTDAEVRRLQLELDGLCAAQERALAVSKERDSLLERVQELREEIEQERSEQHHKLDELRKQNMEEVDSINLKAASELEMTKKDAEERVEKIQVELEKKAAEVIQEFEIVTNKSSTEERELRDRIELLEAEATTSKEEYESKLQQINKDHKLQLDELEPEATASKEEYERKLQLASTDHTMQLDELLAQLDLVEAEHKEKMSESEKATTEKDTIIAALGAELADAHTHAKEIDAAHKKLTVDLDRVQEEAAQAKEECENLKDELETSKSAHDKFMSGEVDRRERACDEAREEMIERAELQFKAANDLYVKLKREYDTAIGKVERLESELKSVKTKLEKAKNEKLDSVADLKAEVADLKASNATTGSDAAQRAKEYRREMEGLLKAANDFERKLEEAESTTQSLESSLSAVVGAKMKLQQEYDEMKNVCEELMVMVEGQPQNRHEC